ncbi:hypothetical protein [Clostridium thermobutyricum]|uniref:hypothetical protein n=1 Tax=Clostridium thermobutyricum TaxID=29372 RepID=UPI0018AA771C|nr:hypothetical protein [Clostridium thermobutyricum]
MKNEKQKYLERHIKKADLELRNIAFPNSKRNFQNDSKTKYVIEYKEGCLGYYRASTNTIAVDPKYFKNMYRHKYNKDLISTLQHEMIHKYIDYNIDSSILVYWNDNSPAFLSILAYFNNRGCNIYANYKYDKIFKRYNKSIYNLAITCKTFMELQIKLIQLKNQTKEFFYSKLRIEEDTIISYIPTYDGESYISSAKLIKQRIINEVNGKTQFLEVYIVNLSAEFNIEDAEDRAYIFDFICSEEGIESEGEYEEIDDYVIKTKSLKMA